MPGPGLVERVAWLVEGQAVAQGEGPEEAAGSEGQWGRGRKRTDWTWDCADVRTPLLLDVGPQAMT